MRRCYKCGAKMETDFIVCPKCEQEIERRRYKMTREEALKVLEVAELTEEEAEKFSVAYDMAVEALKKEPCEDVVSREAVLDIIEFEDKWLLDAKGHNKDTEIAFSGLKTKITKLPSVTPSRHKGHWIDVNERLPEEYGEYMITWVSDYTNKPLISIAEYEITDDFDRKNCRFLGEWLFDEYMSAYTNIKVIAWMPLPEPYKADMRGAE